MRYFLPIILKTVRGENDFGQVREHCNSSVFQEEEKQDLRGNPTSKSPGFPMEISPVLDMDSSPNVMTVPDAALDQSPFGIPYKTMDFTLFYNPMRPLA